MVCCWVVVFELVGGVENVWWVGGVGGCVVCGVWLVRCVVYCCWWVIFVVCGGCDVGVGIGYCCVDGINGCVCVGCICRCFVDGG